MPSAAKVDIKTLTSDPEFQKLGVSDKRVLLGKIDNGFSQLPDTDIQSLTTPPKTDPSSFDVGTAAASAITGLKEGLHPLVYGLGLSDPGDQQRLQEAQQQQQTLDTNPMNAGFHNAAKFGTSLVAGAALGKLAGPLGLVAAPAAITAYNLPSQVEAVQQGQQTPWQAVANTALSTATGFIPGAQTLLGNAVRQGAGQAAANLGSQVVSGNGINWGQVGQEAALGAGVGALTHQTPGAPHAQPVQGRVPVQAAAPPPIETPTPLQTAPDYKAIAADLHQLLTSQTLDDRVQAEVIRKELQTHTRKLYGKTGKRRTIGPDTIPEVAEKIRQGEQAERILQALQLHKESARAAEIHSAKPINRQRLSTEQLQKYTQFGLKYKAMGGDVKAKFDSKIKALHPEDQKIINARIKKTLEAQRRQAETETQRAFERKKSAQIKYKSILAKRQAQRIQEAQARSALLTREREAQRAEIHSAKPINRQRLSTEQLQKYAQFGLKYKAMGGDIKVKFDSKLKALHPEDQKIIQARIKKTLEAQRGQADIETQRAFVRKKNAQTTYKSNLTKHQAQRIQEAQAQSALLKREREAQRAEIHAAKPINRQRLSPDQLQNYTKFGLKYKAMGGDVKAKFDSKLKSLHPEDQQIIQARIKKTLETERGQAETETQRAFIRKKNAQTTYKAAAKPKKAPPRVLSEAEIDRRAEELLKLHQQGKKEALNGQRAQLRAVARKDFTKEGLSADRSRAVNYTHAEILQRADELIAEHDTIEAAKSPTDAEAIKAKATAQSEAQKELDAAKEAGATVDLVQDKGIQAPVHAGQLKWEDVDAYLANKVGKQSPVYQIGAKLAEAMKQGKEVTIRYDSERSGDTGQFQRKRVLPTHFDLQKTGDGYKLVMFATNKQGYTSQYYVEPSVPNAKTGTQSLILETPTIHADKQVTVNTVPNVYAGPKAFSPRALLDRPVRQTVGLTSQLRLGLTDADAYSGKAASYVAKQAGKGGYIGKAAKVISAGLEKSEALNVMIDKSYNETMTPEALSAVEESIAHQGKKSKDILADGVNC